MWVFIYLMLSGCLMFDKVWDVIFLMFNENKICIFTTMVYNFVNVINIWFMNNEWIAR